MPTIKNDTRELVPSGNRTANGSQQFEVPYGSKGQFFLDVTAFGGTNPTLDVKVQARDPVTGNLFDIASFAQKTGVANERIVIGHPADTDFLPRLCTVDWQIGGTAGPNFTFSVGAAINTE